MNTVKIRYFFIAFWVIIVVGALYLYFFQQGFIETQLAGAVSISVVVGSVLYLLLGSLRGFTLIPATPLIVVGLLFFRPIPLFFLTLGGILISSSLIYFFSESLNLARIFEKKHSRQIHRLQRFLGKYELPIVIGWSFFPLAPTDVICYVCGILKIDFKKFLLGVLIGEGICSGIYIFLGDYVLTLLHLR